MGDHGPELDVSAALSLLNKKDASLPTQIACCQNLVASVCDASARHGACLPPKVRQHIKVSTFDWAVQRLSRADKLKVDAGSLLALWEITGELCTDLQVSQSAQVSANFLSAVSYTSQLAASSPDPALLQACTRTLARIAASFRAFQVTREQIAHLCVAVASHLASSPCGGADGGRTTEGVSSEEAHLALAALAVELLERTASTDPSPRKVWELAVQKLLVPCLPLMFAGCEPDGPEQSDVADSGRGVHAAAQRLSDRLQSYFSTVLFLPEPAAAMAAAFRLPSKPDPAPRAPAPAGADDDEASVPPKAKKRKRAREESSADDPLAAAAPVSYTCKLAGVWAQVLAAVTAHGGDVAAGRRRVVGEAHARALAAFLLRGFHGALQRLRARTAAPGEAGAAAGDALPSELPRDADFGFFWAMAQPLLGAMSKRGADDASVSESPAGAGRDGGGKGRKARRSGSGALAGGDDAGGGDLAWVAAAAACAAMLEVCADLMIYRPTEDVDGSQMHVLSTIVASAKGELASHAQREPPTLRLGLCAEVLVNILDLEHRVVADDMSFVYDLIWTCCSGSAEPSARSSDASQDDGRSVGAQSAHVKKQRRDGRAVKSSNHADVPAADATTPAVDKGCMNVCCSAAEKGRALLVSLLEAYASLRQIPAFLDTLFSRVLSTWTPALTTLAHADSVRAAFTRTVRVAPPGQVPELIASVTAAVAKFASAPVGWSDAAASACEPRASAHSVRLGNAPASGISLQTADAVVAFGSHVLHAVVVEMMQARGVSRATEALISQLRACFAVLERSPAAGCELGCPPEALHLLPLLRLHAACLRLNAACSASNPDLEVPLSAAEDLLALPPALASARSAPLTLELPSRQERSWQACARAALSRLAPASGPRLDSQQLALAELVRRTLRALDDASSSAAEPVTGARAEACELLVLELLASTDDRNTEGAAFEDPIVCIAGRALAVLARHASPSLPAVEQGTLGAAFQPDAENVAAAGVALAACMECLLQLLDLLATERLHALYTCPLPQASDLAALGRREPDAKAFTRRLRRVALMAAHVFLAWHRAALGGVARSERRPDTPAQRHLQRQAAAVVQFLPSCLPHLDAPTAGAVLRAVLAAACGPPGCVPPRLRGGCVAALHDASLWEGAARLTGRWADAMLASVCDAVGALASHAASGPGADATEDALSATAALVQVLRGCAAAEDRANLQPQAAAMAAVVLHHGLSAACMSVALPVAAQASEHTAAAVEPLPELRTLADLLRTMPATAMTTQGHASLATALCAASLAVGTLLPCFLQLGAGGAAVGTMNVLLRAATAAGRRAGAEFDMHGGALLSPLHDVATLLDVLEASREPLSQGSSDCADAASVRRRLQQITALASANAVRSQPSAGWVASQVQHLLRRVPDWVAHASDLVSKSHVCASSVAQPATLARADVAASHSSPPAASAGPATPGKRRRGGDSVDDGEETTPKPRGKAKRKTERDGRTAASTAAPEEVLCVPAGVWPQLVLLESLGVAVHAALQAQEHAAAREKHSNSAADVASASAATAVEGPADDDCMPGGPQPRSAAHGFADIFWSCGRPGVAGGAASATAELEACRSAFGGALEPLQRCTQAVVSALETLLAPDLASNVVAPGRSAVERALLAAGHLHVLFAVAVWASSSRERGGSGSASIEGAVGASLELTGLLSSVVKCVETLTGVVGAHGDVAAAVQESLLLLLSALEVVLALVPGSSLAAVGGAPAGSERAAGNASTHMQLVCECCFACLRWAAAAPQRREVDATLDADGGTSGRGGGSALRSDAVPLHRSRLQAASCAVLGRCAAQGGRAAVLATSRTVALALEERSESSQRAALTVLLLLLEGRLGRQQRLLGRQVTRLVPSLLHLLPRLALEGQPKRPDDSHALLRDVVAHPSNPTVATVQGPAPSALSCSTVLLWLRCLESVGAQEASIELPADVVAWMAAAPAAVAHLLELHVEHLFTERCLPPVQSRGEGFVKDRAQHRMAEDVADVMTLHIASCRLLTAMLRHRAPALQGGMPLVAAGCCDLLRVLCTLYARARVGDVALAGRLHAWLLKAAQALAGVYEAIAAHRSAKRFGKLVLLSSLTLTATTPHEVASTSSASTRHQNLPAHAAEALTTGALHLVGVLPPAQLQHMHAVLSGPANSLSRKALADLKRRHDDSFQFKGKS